LYKIYILQLLQVVQALNVLYLVEAEIERSELREAFEAFDVADEVVVEIEVADSGVEVRGEVDFRDLVLAEAEALCIMC
jgi:hypothetical protein